VQLASLNSHEALMGGCLRGRGRMNVHNTIDEARLGIMLKELRLPTIKTLWPQFAEQANCDG